VHKESSAPDLFMCRLWKARKQKESVSLSRIVAGVVRRVCDRAKVLLNDIVCGRGLSAGRSARAAGAYSAFLRLRDNMHTITYDHHRLAARVAADASNQGEGRNGYALVT
jgi:hypothetical protein